MTFEITMMMFPMMIAMMIVMNTNQITRIEDPDETLFVLAGEFQVGD